MTIIARFELSEPVSITLIPPDRRLSPLPDSGLVRCVCAFDGWVAPDGLAPRATLDRLAEQGLLEAWPGRPLYRAPRAPAGSRMGDVA